MDKWIEAYTMQRTGFFLFWRYNVLFDDTPIFVDLSHSMAVQLTAALNGAYNLGYSAHQLVQEFESKKRAA